MKQQEVTKKEDMKKMNSFFASVFTTEDTSTMPPFSEELSKLEITELLVCNKLKSLDPSKSPGIDAINIVLM